MLDSILVGDNPFQGVSHVSGERSRQRRKEVLTSDYAVSVLLAAFEAGAQGFAFSVADNTLRILKRAAETNRGLNLYPIVPAVTFYARQASDPSSLVGYYVREVLRTMNPHLAIKTVVPILNMDLARMLVSYLEWELLRIWRATNRQCNIKAILMHEIVTDLAIAFNAREIVMRFVRASTHDLKLLPGFVTRNLPFLVRRLEEWQIEPSDVVICAPFNKVGFQMNPSKEECEQTLRKLPSCGIIAMSVFAGGYLRPAEAMAYINALPNIRSIIAGVSTVEQAAETFAMLSQSFSRSAGLWHNR